MCKNLFFFPDLSLNFSIKLLHGGEFNKDFSAYIDGDCKFFDMCSLTRFRMIDLESMCKEIGIGEGSYDLWFAIPERELSVDGILPIDIDDDVHTMLDMLVYTKCLTVFTTAKDNSNDLNDFSFTQFDIDERVQRVESMIEECETEGKQKEGEYEDECEGDEEKDDVSFEGDSSNMDSSESEVEISPKKKKRRIPPPNPPFRLRRRGRYSMLRVISLFSALFQIL